MSEAWTIERVMDDPEGARLHIEKLEAENERLGWYYENMRLADRLNLEMQYEYEGGGQHSE